LIGYQKNVLRLCVATIAKQTPTHEKLNHKALNLDW
jgi:hypothetical protein